MKETLHSQDGSGQILDKPKKKQGLGLVLGLLLGGWALWLASRGVNWNHLWAAMRSIDLRWLGMALGCVLLNLLVLTLRWRLLFYPQHTERSWLNLFRGIVIGQALNVIAPGRIGEFARAYAIGTTEGISKAKAIGTIIVEKVMDMAALMMATLVLWESITPPSWAIGLGHALMWITAIATVALLFIALRSELSLLWMRRLSAFMPQKAEEFLAKYAQLVIAGFSAICYRWVHGCLWALSFLLLLFSVLTNYFLFRAFGLTLPVSAALFLLVVLQIGSAPPSLPGKFGVFHYLTVLALTSFMVDRNIALAYSVVLYCVAILSKIIMASLFLYLPFLWHESKNGALANTLGRE